MSRIEAVLRRAARDLESLGRRWALIGGLAVSARTEPRFTRDVDVVIQVSDDADAEELVRRLHAQGYRILGIVEQEAAARLATARLVPGGENEGTALVDLLFASSGIEAEVVAGADVLEVLPGLRVPVATVGHLIALKVLARDDRTRPQDRADLVALSRAATPEDMADARAAIRLIETRGYHRQRDLDAELDRLLLDLRGPA